MRGASIFVVLLIAVTCYSCGSHGTKLHQHQDAYQTAKKLNGHDHMSSVAGDLAAPRKQLLHSDGDQLESRQKRSQRLDGADLKDFNSLFGAVDDGTPTPAHDAYDLDSMPPITYYLLLQKLKQLQSAEPVYRVRTPRLGRSIDFQQFLDGGGADGGGDEDINMPRQFVSHMLKKSVPFKPRLGKRGPQCDRLMSE